MRSLAAFALSLLLAITSVGLAMANAEAPMSSQAIEICATEGAVTVILDANGNPAPAHHHHCPACLAALAAADIAAPVALPQAPGTATRLTAALGRTQSHSHRTRGANARAPPAFRLI